MKGLIDVARKLATANPKRPSQPFLRRAISTAYYALFDALAADCADLLVGTGQKRNAPAWTLVFRGMDHATAKKGCKSPEVAALDARVVSFAAAFVTLQEERHKADYDPSGQYNRANVLVAIRTAEIALQNLKAAPKTDRRQLAACVLFRKRS
jgi:uncharacterized protein (UPF0332 family)